MLGKHWIWLKNTKLATVALHMMPPDITNYSVKKTNGFIDLFISCMLLYYFIIYTHKLYPSTTLTSPFAKIPVVE